MLSSQQIQSNWPTIKSHVLTHWNKLSEAEVERTHGDTASLGKLVNNKYGNKENFDKAFEKICKNCIPSSRNTVDYDKAQPKTETEFAGYRAESNEMDEFHSGSPERRLNANFANVEYDEKGVEREADDELSAYNYERHSHAFNEYEDNRQFDTHYNLKTDEFSQYQDPSSSSEDITLGRGNSSATNKSTANAASKSSDVSLADTKKNV